MTHLDKQISNAALDKISPQKELTQEQQQLVNRIKSFCIDHIRDSSIQCSLFMAMLVLVKVLSCPIYLMNFSLLQKLIIIASCMTQIIIFSQSPRSFKSL